MIDQGRVEWIHIASAAGEPMRALERVRAAAGEGLEGDRYRSNTGHWSAIRRSGDRLTLVEAEEVESIAATYGLDLPPGSTRRNLTTRGVRLDELIGRRFRIGELECRGVRRCEPCSYLDQLLDQEVLRVLVHRGGIRVEIVSDGEIAVGDPIEVLPD
jgi:MOSC domain-containing protein YiiM